MNNRKFASSFLLFLLCFFNVCNVKAEPNPQILPSSQLPADSQTNLLFEDKNIIVLQKEQQMVRNWLNPYYDFYRLAITNKSNQPMTINGDILNKIYRDEAHVKVLQVIFERKKLRDEAILLGFLTVAATGGLAAFVGGTVTETALIIDIIDETSDATILALIHHFLDEYSEDKLVRQINNLLPYKNGFSFEIPARSEDNVFFLLKKDRKPIMGLQYALTDGQSGFFSLGMNPKLAKALINNSLRPSIHQKAYVNGKLLKHEAGLYASDASGNWTAIKPSVRLPLKTEKPGNHNIKIAGCRSQNILTNEQLQLFIQQNIHFEPRRYQLTLFRLKENCEQNYRIVKGYYVPFALHEIEPGLLKVELNSGWRAAYLSPLYFPASFWKKELKLRPGQYGFLYKDGECEMVYDFEIRN